MQSLPHRSFLRWKFCLFGQGYLRNSRVPHISIVSTISHITSLLLLYLSFVSISSLSSLPFMFLFVLRLSFSHLLSSDFSLFYSIYYIYPLKILESLTSSRLWFKLPKFPILPKLHLNPFRDFHKIPCRFPRLFCVYLLFALLTFLAPLALNFRNC